ncbi:MAG: hypothetical protein IKA59_02350 [Clostridia bacterium]|nr:hypothetical protein [Clostridia bacterium]
MAIIEPKFYSWVNKYCPNKLSISDAVNKAYAPSIRQALWQNGRHCGFKGMTTAKQSARAQATQIIECYLQDVHNYNLLPDSVTDLWDKVRDVYHNNNITWYTYGNAQKWVSMAIKYYLVDKYRITPNALCNDVLADVVFPIDRIMINKIQSGIVVAGNGSNIRISANKRPPYPSWSQCDNKQTFIDYIDAVKNELIKSPTQDKLIEFEINNW